MGFLRNIEKHTSKCLFLLFICILSSCHANEENIENENIENFNSLSIDLEKVIKLVEKKYYNTDAAKKSNNMQFIVNIRDYQAGNVLSDEQIYSWLRKTNIFSISFLKSSTCTFAYTYDMVKFKIRTDNSHYSYAYIFEYCPTNQKMIDKPNYKSIPLRNLWSLAVEKN